MKKLLSLILCLSIFCTISFAQKKSDQKDKGERIKALKIAYITENLDLTSAEAEKFWPIYNKYNEERKALKERYKVVSKSPVNSDKEAEEKVSASLEYQEKQLALKRKYLEQFKNYIPVQKVAKLPEVEKQFRKQIVEEIKRRRQKQGRKAN